MNTEQLLRAFEETRSGWSPDRVVADPVLNQAFLMRCEQLGLRSTAFQLNHGLLNLRKTGRLRGHEKSRSTRIANLDESRFASEVAVRHLERRDASSLDRIICDPASAREFDEIARAITPGFESLQYRWGALGLRKGRSLRPEAAARLCPPVEISLHSILGLDPDVLPNDPGLYLFLDKARGTCLYVGQSLHLGDRLRKHLEHSDNRYLARHLWSCREDDIVLEVHRHSPGTPTRSLKALEAELIRSRNPEFNSQGVA